MDAAPFPGRKHTPYCKFTNIEYRYHCVTCEYFDNGCKLGRNIIEALAYNDYDRLPYSVAEEIRTPRDARLIEETQEILDRWNSRILDPKRLP